MKTPAWSENRGIPFESWHPPTMSPAALIPMATVLVALGEVDRREGTAAADESMLTGAVEVIADHLSGIVDADDLSSTRARKSTLLKVPPLFAKPRTTPARSTYTPTIRPAPFMPVARLRDELGTVRIW